MNNFFYLHGWASSPQSNKAQFFKQSIEQRGFNLQVPDFNQNDFYNITLTRQIQQVEALLPDSPVTLIGSSFGGLTALWLAERQPQVQRIILLAPALDFFTNIKNVLSETQYALWQRQGELAFYHYSIQQELLVSYGFIEDMQQYVDAKLQRNLPTLILHGRFDKVIPIQASRNFAASRPWVELVEFDSDHSLKDVQTQLWHHTAKFCQVKP